jgi:predicted  nucleic acid-binding Zn-ribbon protein
MVVEYTLEEQVSNIREFIKGFYTRIEDLESHTMPGTTPEEKEERERNLMTAVASIKRLEEECANLCEESTQIWTNMMDDPKMNSMESILRGV